MADKTSTRRDFLVGCSAIAFCFGLPIATIEALSTNALERRYPMPSADSVSIDQSAAVILVRRAGFVYAFSLSCPHEHAAVKWVDKAGRFQCTKHDSRYDPIGVHTAGRATRNLDRFPIQRDGATLVVDTSKVWHSDTSPAEWAAATISV